MKKIWTFVAWIAGIMLILGIVFAAAAYFMGGNIGELYDSNEAARNVIYGLSPEYIKNLILGFLGVKQYL